MSNRAVSLPSTETVALAPWNGERSNLAIWNFGTDTIFVSVDRINVAAEGWPILINTGLSYVWVDGDDSEEALYAVANSGTQDIRVIEQFGLSRLKAERGL